MEYDLSPGTYTDLVWDGPFAGFNMVRILSIGDGSCLLHSIANAYFTPYRLEKLNGLSVSRRQIVRQLRDELAVHLAEPVDPLQPDGPRVYDNLANGEQVHLGKELPQEYGLEALLAKLRSDDAMGDEFIELISDRLDKDLYVLDAATRDVYMLGDGTFIKGRDSIVLLFLPGHYELIGLRVGGSIQTHFSPHHALIQAIRSRADKLRELGSRR